jgi:hypothetical protein
MRKVVAYCNLPVFHRALEAVSYLISVQAPSYTAAGVHILISLEYDVHPFNFYDNLEKGPTASMNFVSLCVYF